VLRNVAVVGRRIRILRPRVVDAAARDRHAVHRHVELGAAGDAGRLRAGVDLVVGRRRRRQLVGIDLEDEAPTITRDVGLVVVVEQLFDARVGRVLVGAPGSERPAIPLPGRVGVAPAGVHAGHEGALEEEMQRLHLRVDDDVLLRAPGTRR